MLLPVHRHSAMIVLETVVSATSCYSVTMCCNRIPVMGEVALLFRSEFRPVPQACAPAVL